MGMVLVRLLPHSLELLHVAYDFPKSRSLDTLSNLSSLQATCKHACIEFPARVVLSQVLNQHDECCAGSGGASTTPLFQLAWEANSSDATGTLPKRVAVLVPQGLPLLWLRSLLRYDEVTACALSHAHKAAEAADVQSSENAWQAKVIGACWGMPWANSAECACRQSMQCAGGTSGMASPQCLH